MLTWENIFNYSATAPLIFSQYLFLFLFSIAYFIYVFIYRSFHWRTLFLFAFSLFFYYRSGGYYFWLLIVSTLVDYGCGWAIHKATSKSKRNLFLILSLVSNLGMLFFFKYSYYIVDLLNGWFDLNLVAKNYFALLANMWTGSEYDILEILLPVGISFYTFQTLSYTIDIYRKQLEPVKSIIDFGFFVSFFPQLVAGPIVRAADFIPQIRKPFHLTNATFGYAVYLISVGLFKKVVISDYLSVNFVDRVFEDPTLYDGFMNLMAVYGYSIQIYCDFSGYSDMAIGLAALLGFKLPINFNSPYKATSITDFWRRWHISLSSWLRDYLYISMGGNRKGKIRTYIHLMLTMLIGGLWHGAATRFIIWGGLHGVALALHKVWMQIFPKLSHTKSWAYKLLAGIITFHFVALCWIYFRATDMAHITDMLTRIGYHFDWAAIGTKIAEYSKVFWILLLGFCLHFIPTSWKKFVQNLLIQLPWPLKAVYMAIVVLITYQAVTAGIQPFIYFDF